MKFLLFILFTIFLKSSAQISCPTTHFTFNTNSGKIPANAENLTTFPRNFDCSYTFDIVPGYAIRFNFQASYSPSSGDSFQLINSLNETFELNYPEVAYYAPAQTATVRIHTGNTAKNAPQFFFTYVYIQVATYTKIAKKTGEYISLDFSGQKYYTFNSDLLDNIALSVTDESDLLNNYYVYDGPSVNYNYIGSLKTFLATQKTKAVGGILGLTLVNYYTGTSKAYILANDASAVNKYSHYRVKAVSKTYITSGNMTDTTDNYSAFTFICIDCTEIYFTSIVFKLQYSNSVVEFHPMTPTHNLKTLLTAHPSSQAHGYPQQFPTNLMTMVVKHTRVEIKIDPNAQADWQLLSLGRRVVLFSPSWWNPGVSPAYSYSFTTALNAIATIDVNVRSVAIYQSGESLRITVGTPTSVSLDRTYTISQGSTDYQRTQGSYLTATYSGNNPNSSSCVIFNVVDPNAPTTTSTTTTQRSITTTTTANSRRESIIGSILLILIAAFNL